VDISDKSDISVSLVNANASLNEVVVTGYGTARRRDVTGAIASVQSKDFIRELLLILTSCSKARWQDCRLLTVADNPVPQPL